MKKRRPRPAAHARSLPGRPSAPRARPSVRPAAREGLRWPRPTARAGEGGGRAGRSRPRSSRRPGWRPLGPPGRAGWLSQPDFLLCRVPCLFEPWVARFLHRPEVQLLVPWEEQPGKRETLPLPSCVLGYLSYSQQRESSRPVRNREKLVKVALPTPFFSFSFSFFWKCTNLPKHSVQTRSRVWAILVNG